MTSSECSRSHQGFTVFFTGLPGAGKSTTANMLRARLLENGGRPVSLLDGDAVRKHLSSDLGFSREDRNENIRRIGTAAAEITRNGGIAICAPISPYDSDRKAVRQMISSIGGFFLVHVNTPIHVCEARDLRGLYVKARAGILFQFTGVSDPYEPPGDAEITIDTTHTSAENAANIIVKRLHGEGYIP
jgi:sulfate adenylyltransferase